MDAQKERNTSIALAISGWSIALISLVVGNIGTDLTPILFFIPLGGFTGVLGLLRLWIKPKPGRKFFAPGIWWGAIYASIGLLFSVPALMTPPEQDPWRLAGPIAIVGLALFSVPGFTVMAMGIVRSSKVNKSLKGE